MAYKKLPTDIPTFSVDNFSKIPDLKNTGERKSKFIGGVKFFARPSLTRRLGKAMQSRHMLMPF